MKTAIVLGATGLIGKKVTEYLLKDDAYSTVIILVRKTLNINHPKLKQHIFNYDEIDNTLLKGDDLFCCLGTTIKTAGSKDAFRKVDLDYVVNVAKAAKENGINHFAVVSSMGADKHSNIFYNKTKGEMEEAIKSIGFDSTYIIRPSLLLGNRKEFRVGELIVKFFMISLSFLIPKKYRAIYDVQVALAMIHFMNQTERGFFVKENDELLNNSSF
jgi:uncharacterized protein YbjT (DUF2867 family)